MKKILIGGICLLLLFTALAHEYILLAYKFKVAKGDMLELHLFVADGFNIEMERPMQTAITTKFELINENGTSNLLSNISNGTLPIVNMKADFDGLGLFNLERGYAKNTMDTKKFMAYLKEDHIENITVSNDPNKTTQRERYTRYIKTLVHSGQEKADTLYKTITAQKFEIILLQNPYLLHKGDKLNAQVFFMGRPLANKIITARSRKGSEKATVALSRTNKNGICSFKITNDGDWFLHATNMIPSTDKNEADWESFWTSYSFGIN